MKKEEKKVEITRELIDLFRQNEGLQVSLNDLTSDKPTVISRTGCIKRLVYGDGDANLIMVQLVGGFNLNLGNTLNLSDFRETFKCAANHGHGVTFCYWPSQRKVTMVHLLPCKCNCGNPGPFPPPDPSDPTT